MVGRLVQQQNVRLLNHQPAQGHPALFASGKHAHFLIGGRATQRIHGDFQFAFEFPAIRRLDLLLQLRLLVDELFHLIRARFAHAVADRFVFVQQGDQFFLAFFHDFFHGLVGVELRLLLEQADGVALGTGDLAHIIGIHPGDDFQQRAFPGPVQPENADLGAIIKTQVDIAEYLLLRWIDFAYPDQ